MRNPQFYVSGKMAMLYWTKGRKDSKHFEYRQTSNKLLIIQM